MTIDQILTNILEREGWPKVTNYPFDRGGLTKGGITKGALEAFLGRPATDAELVNLDEATARAVLTKLVVAPGFHQIADPHIREFVVDIGIMSGPSTATKLLQRAVGVKDDGIFGPITRRACDAADPRRLTLDLMAERVLWLDRVVQNDPALKQLKARDPDTAKKLQVHNLAGWHNRTLKFRHYAAPESHG